MTKSRNNCKRSYAFTLEIIDFISKLPSESTFWVFKDQLIRSGTSIGTNIHEAKSASSRRDFINFYNIALKSANETEYWIRLLIESKLCKSTKLLKLQVESKELIKMIASSILTLKRTKMRVQFNIFHLTFNMSFEEITHYDRLFSLDLPITNTLNRSLSLPLIELFL